VSLAFVASGTTASGTNGNPTPSAPTGIVAGDLLICVIGWRGSTTTMTSSGWTEMSGSPWTNATSATDEIRALWKISAGTESGAITFTKTGGGVNQSFNSIIFALRGTPPDVSAFDVIGAKTDGASAQNVGPLTGLTPTAAGAWVFVVAEKADDWTSVATLTGDSLTWNEITEVSTISGSDGGLVIDYGTGWTSGAITSKTFTVTGGAANTSVGVLFTVKPDVERRQGDRHNRVAPSFIGRV
jgi:hypothetical protein